MIKTNDIQVEVTYTEGYEKRYTQCCLSQLKKRRTADSNDLCENDEAA